MGHMACCIYLLSVTYMAGDAVRPPLRPVSLNVMKIENANICGLGHDLVTGGQKYPPLMPYFFIFHKHTQNSHIISMPWRTLFGSQFIKIYCLTGCLDTEETFFSFIYRLLLVT